MFNAKTATIGLMMLSISFNALSGTNLDSFKKRFSFVKNDEGKVTYVRMNLLNKKWSIVPYVRQVRDDVKREISRMQTKSYQNEMEGFYDQLQVGNEKSAEAQENIFAIRDSINNLESVDVDGFFAMAETKGVLAKFQKELKEALMLLDLSVIASTEDARYFYKRNVTYEVVKRAIDFAKDRFDNVPLLNLVSFVMVQVHELVLEQRLFHQNMLLHYLQNVKEADMGLSINEADMIFSSIYESRISAINYRESNTASETWTRYGLNKFYGMVRTANNRLRRSNRTFDEVGARYNFGFFEAKENGERVVKNLIQNKHKFSSDMATAYNYDKPDAVRRFRSLLNLGQVGLGFLPLPSWLKNQVESFIESYYVEQKRLEGALVGYFDINGNQVMSQNIKEQLINPYIVK
jgi:hypothetical protein